MNYNMYFVKAIILAAGRSKRLGVLTDKTPKCCLQLINEESILDRSLKNIKECNFSQIVIVTGHADTIIKDSINKWQNSFKSIELIHNPEYLEKNNVYSVYLVREMLDSQTFIFNSDIVYDLGILQNLIASYNKEPRSLVVVDDTEPLDEEDMKVRIQDNKISRINKNQDPQICAGEYIGILHLNGQDIEVFKKSLEYMIEAGQTDMYYEDAIDRQTSEMNVGTVSTQGLSWSEIDTPEDYQKAKELPCVKSQYQTA